MARNRTHVCRRWRGGKDFHFHRGPGAMRQHRRHFRSNEFCVGSIGSTSPSARSREAHAQSIACPAEPVEPLRTFRPAVSVAAFVTMMFSASMPQQVPGSVFSAIVRLGHHCPSPCWTLTGYRYIQPASALKRNWRGKKCWAASVAEQPVLALGRFYSNLFWIAFALATPVSWWLMNNWLAEFGSSHFMPGCCSSFLLVACSSIESVVCLRWVTNPLGCCTGKLL